MNKFFLSHGLIAAALSSIGACAYNIIYAKSLYVDFSSVLNIISILSACTFTCVLIALGDFVFTKWKNGKFTGYYNLFVLILSFVSSIGVLTFSLPLDVPTPELFPGLAIPMHFFPALAYFSLAPFFNNTLSEK